MTNHADYLEPIYWEYRTWENSTCGWTNWMLLKDERAKEPQLQEIIAVLEKSGKYEIRPLYLHPLPAAVEQRCGVYDGTRAAQKAKTFVANQSPLVAETNGYNRQRIAYELDATASGQSFHGNALRVAKDLPEATTEERSVLDRWAAGAETTLEDKLTLQTLAIKIRCGGEL